MDILRHARTELNYSGAYLFDIFQSEQFNKIHPNLTEGLYPNCEYTDIDQAEINRFDKFMKLCNIEPGDSVLDAGCGNGDLVEYLRKKVLMRMELRLLSINMKIM